MRLTDPASAGVLVALVLTGCSQQPAADAQPGKLWPYREQLAQDLTFRTGKLDSTLSPWVRPCHEYWATGEAANADTSPALCDENARNMRGALEKHLGVQLSLDDVTDPALWRYLQQQGKV